MKKHLLIITLAAMTGLSSLCAQTKSESANNGGISFHHRRVSRDAAVLADIAALLPDWIGNGFYRINKWRAAKAARLLTLYSGIQNVEQVFQVDVVRQMPGDVGVFHRKPSNWSIQI